MHELLPPYHYRRTEADMSIDFAEELQAEPNVVGRARYEPASEGAIEVIAPGAAGIEYTRTVADYMAELKADRIDDSRWRSSPQ